MPPSCFKGRGDISRPESARIRLIGSSDIPWVMSGMQSIHDTFATTADRATQGRPVSACAAAMPMQRSTHETLGL